jgi:PAS domain S-box-containing protein
VGTRDNGRPPAQTGGSGGDKLHTSSSSDSKPLGPPRASPKSDGVFSSTMIDFSSFPPKSVKAFAATMLCALSVLLFGGLSITSVLNVPDEVRRSAEIVDIAGAQRKNALSLLLAVQDSGPQQDNNASSVNASMSHFLAHEQEINTYLNAQAASQLGISQPAAQSQELIDAKIAELLRMLSSVGTVSAAAADMEEISRFVRGPFISALDDRVKELTEHIAEAQIIRLERYLAIGVVLLLVAGGSGALLFKARAGSLQKTLSLLTKRNAQMETVEEVSKVGYWEVDLADQKPTWSRQTRLIHEVGDEFEPNLEAAIEFYAPEYRDQITKAVETAMETGAEWDLELQIITAKRNRRWVRAKGRPVYKNGDLVALVGSFQDITETKRRELELSDALEQKASALAAVTDLTNAIHSAAIVTIADKDGKIIQINQQFTTISGYVDEDVLGRDHSVLNSGYHDSKFFANLWRTVKNGNVWRGEICNRAKNGELYWVDTTIYPILGESGTPEKYMSIRFDVTKRFHAAKMASNYFEVSLAPNCIVDAEGVFLKANNAFCEMLGLPRAEVEGRPFSDFVVENDHFDTAKELEKLNKGGETIGFRNTYRVASGEERVIEWQARQSDTLIFASARDITAILQQEEALSAARQSAEDANNTKSAFLANMSHEIRTPLNGIIGVADVLARDGELTDEQQDLVDMISDSGRMLEKLLSDILDFSKIEAGKLSIEETAFCLENEVRAALDLHMISAEWKGVDFQLKSELQTEQTVIGDSLRMRQILSNLASNAVKYTESGSISASAMMRQHAGKWHLDFSIRDTGVGFPVATRGNVFKRFDQMRASDARHFGGTGLGLAISASLAGLMDGTLEVDSIPGVGTRFDLSLPFELASKNTSDVSRTDRWEDRKHELKGLHLLVAEDMAANQKLLSLLLSPLGCKITFASQGLEAIDLFRTCDFDVILLDMMMPEMGGLEAAAEIRKIESEEHRSRTPIAMLSANAMREHVESAKLAGCDVHISKPVNRAKIINGIHTLLHEVRLC